MDSGWRGKMVARGGRYNTYAIEEAIPFIAQDKGWVLMARRQVAQWGYHALNSFSNIRCLCTKVIALSGDVYDARFFVSVTLTTMQFTKTHQ